MENKWQAFLPQEWPKPQLQNSMLLPSKDGYNDAGMDTFNAGKTLNLGALGTSAATVEKASDSLGSTNLDMGPNFSSEQNSPVAAEMSVSPGKYWFSNPAQGLREITFERKRGVKRRRRVKLKEHRLLIGR